MAESRKARSTSDKGAKQNRVEESVRTWYEYKGKPYKTLEAAYKAMKGK
jgi:hypothetical protein